MKIYVPGKMESSKLKGLVYSDPGVGKTIFAAISQDALIINCEAGLMCLDKISEYQPQLGFMAVDVSSMQELTDVFHKIKTNDPVLADRKLIVIDSLIELSQISMDEILNDSQRDAKYDRLTPNLKDYQKNTNRMRKIVRAFRDLDRHVIFTCHAMNVKDEETGSINVMPALTPKLSVEVMGYVDLVGYMFVDRTTGQRKMLFQPKGRFSAKDRSGKLGLGMVEPTAYEVIASINREPIPDYVYKAKALLKNTEAEELETSEETLGE